MASLIETKKALVNERTEFIKELLEELTRSNSSFSSSRKLSVYIAQKMKESGKPVDSSTLRRSGAPYKALIDNFIGKKEERPDTQTKLNLRIRKKNSEIDKLTSELRTKQHRLEAKEREIRHLLVEAQDKQKKVIASVSPPQASTYTQTELTQLKESHGRDRGQLNKALEVIETLLKPELKATENDEGSFEMKNGKVTDLLNDRDLFNEEDLPDFFTKR
ncbi:conserved hypothetical protein [Vibrio crassostreae]|nr:conserved hypothetical protein [Vibrio crassostreae]CAK3501864.1 conserved hypothetical protein [Vibrio crassostreae]